MYAAKIVIGAATVVLSGSLWLVPTTAYVLAATLLATWREDRAMGASLAEYGAYQARTTLLFPWLG